MKIICDIYLTEALRVIYVFHNICISDIILMIPELLSQLSVS